MGTTEFLGHCQARGLPFSDRQLRHAERLGYFGKLPRVGGRFVFTKRHTAAARKYLFGLRGPRLGRPRGCVKEVDALE